ncbi:MAG: hypothetical protein K2K37_09005 [Muribaculaceae bacterium]|nr:hypothetical protein [Muribaculaceae bacterium]
MKRLLSLTLLLSTLLLCLGQQSASDPVIIGSTLVNKSSLDQMADICQWNQLIEQPSEDGFRVFRHDDGTLIKFKMSDDKIPYIEVQTTQSRKKIEKSLFKVGFSKDKERYIRGSIYAIRYTTAETLGNKNKRVIFTLQESVPQ